MDDIRYNFLIGNSGTIFEGRGWGRIGEHTPGYNEDSFGICIIGYFHKSVVKPAAKSALNILIDCAKQRVGFKTILKRIYFSIYLLRYCIDHACIFETEFQVIVNND